MSKEVFEIHDQVRSRRDHKIQGEVIGFGTLQWTDYRLADDQLPVLVYLVKVKEEGSSAFGPAVVVLRVNQTEGRWQDE